MHEARNMAIVRRFYAAGASDDDTERLPLFAPDAVWHVPGANPVTDDYVGPDDISSRMAARMAPLGAWNIGLRDVMANRNLVVATVHVTGERNGVTIDTGGAHVFRLDGAGRIVEAWGFVADQAGLDDFFRAS